MLNKTQKLCKSCNKQPPMMWRRDCLVCINKKQKELAREKKTKAVTKVKARKEKAKEKKVNSISYLSDKTDDLWAIAVKVNFNYRCQYCNKWPDEVQLHSHHLFTRSRKSTRWDIENWICLCASHHTLSSEFSAHKTGNEFFIWLEWIKGREWIDMIASRSNQIVHITPDYIKERKEEIEKFIENNK